MSEVTENIEENNDSHKFLSTVVERFAFIAFLTLVSCGPILFDKSIPSHADWHIHIEHAYNFKRCLLQGDLLPRWIDAHVNGYGLPIFNFYAPLPYYLFTVLELFFKNVIYSIKWTFLIPMIMCSIFGYIYLRKHGSPIASTIAMAFVIFSPAIHIFIYNTNWPGSTMALAFIFLALYGIDSFDKEKKFDLRTCLIVSFSYACMILTHLASAFMFTIVAVPYFVFSLFTYKSVRFIQNFIASMTLGGLIGGFYLFPAALEKKFVHTDEVLTQGPLWDFSKNFLFTYLDRSTNDGYAWGIFDHRYYEVSNALFSTICFICFFVLLANFDRVKKYFKDSIRITTALSMFFITFLMMTPVSFLVWTLIKPLQTVQFPWRFTAFVLPFGALLIVYTFDLFGSMKKEKLPVGSLKIIFSILFFVLGGLAYVDFINMYKWKWVPSQSLLKASMYVLWGNEEYRPKVIENKNWKQFNFKQDFSPVIQPTDQRSIITLKEWKSHDREFEIFSERANEIRLRLLYFPGWHVYVDGVETKIRLDQQKGSIIFNTPPGEHQIRVVFKQTPVRMASSILSLAAFLLYLFLLSIYLKSIILKIPNRQELEASNANQ